MRADRFHQIAARFSSLRLAVVGDFCLDRYLEIDATLQETSLETGLPVHNVIRVRAQPGGAGTILGNLAALGVGEVFAVGFAGDDGEGSELFKALRACSRVRLDYFFQTPLRRTFTYCKPLLLAPGAPPTELSRFDSKNWTPTPRPLRQSIAEAIGHLTGLVQGIILLEQTEAAETGVVCPEVLAAVHRGAACPSAPLVLADSRRGLADYPPFSFKMNRAEFCRLTGLDAGADLNELGRAAAGLARRNGQPVFVTLAEQGIIGSDAGGCWRHSPALPARGQLDIVGAGDAVTASLAASLAAGADMEEALQIAMAAASVVIHKLGTTGTATPAEMWPLLAD